MGAGNDWLMVIDVQPAFSHPDSPWFTPALPGVAGRIAQLVCAFEGRVAFTRFVPPTEPSGAWLRYYERWPFALQPAAAWLWDLDTPWAGQPSLASHTFSKWLLPMRGRVGPNGAAVLCGVSTDCCVLMTALAAVDDGVPVRVIADACAAKTPDVHGRALDIMASRAPMLDIVMTEQELSSR